MSDASNDFTPNLSLPFLLPSQAQKHVTVNESLAAIDALVMATVISVELSDPPSDPSQGDAYLLLAEVNGAWVGHSGELAVWADGAWTFYGPKSGWRVWDITSQTPLVFNGNEWSPLMGAAPGASEFGINTAADSTNRLAVKSDAALLS